MEGIDIMKKLFGLIVTAAVALLLVFPAAAETLTYEDYKYIVNSNGISVTITDYTGSATELTIPDEINGYAVTALGSAVFQDRDDLTNVVIPGSVKKIGEGAFFNCSGLKSVTIPENVIQIGNYAFKSCSGLTKVELPKSVVKIGIGAFSQCTSLISVAIPESVTTIEE